MRGTLTTICPDFTRLLVPKWHARRSFTRNDDCLPILPIKRRRTLFPSIKTSSPVLNLLLFGPDHKDVSKTARLSYSPQPHLLNLANIRCCLQRVFFENNERLAPPIPERGDGLLSVAVSTRSNGCRPGGDGA